MAQGALFVGWGPLIPGREKAGARVLNEAMRYLEREKESGRLDSIEVAVLEPHGSTLSGFVLVKGEKDTLAKLRVEDEFVEMIVAVQLVHENVRVTGAYTGAELQSTFEMWDRQESRLL